MKRAALFFCLFVLKATIIFSQQTDFPKLTGPYLGQTPPGMIPEVFAPGIVSSTNNRELGGCTFSPDGKEFYFTRSDGNRWVIMVSRSGKDGWKIPEPFKISEGHTALEPHITFDNSKIFWVWRGLEDQGMYMAQRVAEGWSDAEFAGPGMMISSTVDGQMYVTDYRFDPAEVVSVEFIDGHLTNYKKLTGEIEEFQKKFRTAHPCISPDGSYIVFDHNAVHMYVSFKNQNGDWDYPIDLTKHGFPVDAGIASISPDGDYLFFGYNNDIYWVSSKIIVELRSK